MQLNPYLNFNGCCEEAFRFYEKCFGGKIVALLNHGETPMGAQVPPEWRKKIVHARLVVDGMILMGSDVPPERYQKPAGFSVTIGIKEPVEAERIFKSLSENGTVTMAIEQTFWAWRFGMLIDQFGIPWMINCEKVA